MSAAAWIAVGAARRRRGGRRASCSTPCSPPPARQPFPLGILAVNLLGALALGLVAGARCSGEALTIVAGGGIGSFTTFSTWMLDSHRLAEAGRPDLAWLNIGLSLVAGFAAVALGHWLGAAL